VPRRRAEILTPLVSLFVGSAMAVSLGGRRNAYLNGFMIWCIFVAAVAFYLGRDLGTVTARAEAIGLTGASAAALAGFSALLGLTGAFMGSAIGKRLARYEFARKHEEREEEEELPEAPVHH
jgi:positive regulator of sigma E activity